MGRAAANPYRGPKGTQAIARSHWISKPATGIQGMPLEFVYVLREQQRTALQWLGMCVQSLKVAGFMSFKDVTWKPERLNVLIGPNGSGKSNLLRALELIRASAAGNLRDFVLNKGGLPRLLWGGSARQIEIETDTGIDHSSERQTYRFMLGPVPQSASFRIVSEALEGDKDLSRDPAKHLPETETALSMVSALWIHPAPYLLQQQIRAWAIYQDLHVDEDAPIRRSAVARKETRVSYNGQNLIPVLKTLYEGEFKDAIDSGMSAAFPDDYAELFFRRTEPDRIQLYIRRRHGHREDSAADLSDGTLRFLLLLTILATPDPPPLIAIEEPESGLHPSMLPIIAEFAAAAATRTQLILSTHSPQMLDAFGATLPAATIFDWAGDHTELKTVRGAELQKWIAEYSLGRFIFSGEAAAVL
jgi:predicted ATPase